MHEFWNNINGWLRDHILTITIAQITGLLVVYGDLLSQKMSRLLSKQSFFLRLSGFIGINAFLIGFLTIFIAKLISLFYLRIPQNYLLLTLLSGFVLVGVIAERHKHI
ncbi:hypothetical protein LNTAR_03444 [Lentisphaera araneosa HTCC2155]|jgi:hypothetical protein|uniref:DUF3392 domain-containing protein n=1 Tax=Lentisphaera araneosa HTCC2155 TaxID=313628 RepID=A6DSP7_9BACT|nr:DUF3392 family protein [Lentisphaera araneosa]EDM25300.1 hypothetical protein LNTAR_03444 [Lentisphaera araneosa HTCC2155]